MRLRPVVIMLTIVILLTFSFSNGYAADRKATKEIQAKPTECYECHGTIKELHTSGKHAKVGCANCHSGIDKHLANPGAETRPFTDMAWEACGNCHKEEYKSFMKGSYHRPGRDEKSQLTNR